jgi:thiopeptide-type bacteriocin biosynthesis protein
VITDVVGPTVAGLSETTDTAVPWFFMRYWQGGPHLRLRIRGLTPESAERIGDQLTAALLEVGALRTGEQKLDSERFSAQSARLAAAGEGDRLLATPKLLSPGVHASGYLPELDRYGGAAMMAASESLFEISSRICLVFLRSAPSGAARATLALRATAAAARVLGDIQYLSDGAVSWHRWLTRFGSSEMALERLDAECARVALAAARDGTDLSAAPGSGLLAAWQAGLGHVLPEWQRSATTEPTRIVFSHVHMLHNRLGLSAAEELRSYSALEHYLSITGANGV